MSAYSAGAQRLFGADLELYWRLGANGHLDESGNARDGTAGGGITLGGGAGLLGGGETGTSTVFDGTDDRVSTSAYDGFVDGEVRSYLAWLVRDTNATADIVFGTAGAISVASVIGWGAGTDDLSLRVNNTPAIMAATPELVAQPGLLVVTFDEPNNLAKTYVNGAFKGSVAQSQARAGGATGFRVGCHATSSLPLVGRVQEAMIVSREVSEGEQLELYLLGRAGGRSRLVVPV